MKTYDETITMLGDKAWHNLMDGFSNKWDDINLDLVAFIHDKTSEQVFNDIDAEFEKCIERYNSK